MLIEVPLDDAHVILVDADRRLDHDGFVYAVGFSPDGSRVATASDDGSARVYELDVDLVLDRVFTAMTRPLSPAELRRYSLPPDCRHVQEWQRRRRPVIGPDWSKPAE